MKKPFLFLSSPGIDRLAADDAVRQVWLGLLDSWGRDGYAAAPMKIRTRVRLSLLMAFTALCQSLPVGAAPSIRVETGQDVDRKVFF
jgi:hypothetical protein